MLEIGCSAGYGTQLLAQYAREVTAVDIDAEAIEHAASSSNITFLLVDGRELPFPDKFFDAVVSFEVIEHVKDPHRFLQEIKRVIKPGGIVILSTPDHSVSAAMGIRHSKKLHISPLNFDSFSSLVKSYFSSPKFYGQYFLKGKNTISSKFLDLARRIDIFDLRKMLLTPAVRSRLNTPARLRDDQDWQIKPLHSPAGSMLVVCTA